MPVPLATETSKTAAANFQFCLFFRQESAKILANSSARRQIAEIIPNSANSLADSLSAVGVGEPQIALAIFAKAGAGDRCHAGLFEQMRLQCTRVVTGPADVGEGIEGTPGLLTAKARQPVQRLDDHLAPLGKFRDHAVYRLARPGQRGNPGVLCGGVDAGMTVDREPLGVPKQRLGPYRITQPPAGHRVGLAPAVEQD